MRNSDGRNDGDEDDTLRISCKLCGCGFRASYFRMEAIRSSSNEAREIGGSALSDVVVLRRLTLQQGEIFRQPSTLANFGNLSIAVASFKNLLDHESVSFLGLEGMFASCVVWDNLRVTRCITVPLADSKNWGSFSKNESDSHSPQD